MNKGTEFLAPVEEGVQAIATGRVLYAGRMPVFGLVVVLDHGERSYSLYGRLATTARSVGEDLQQGEIVGTLGAPEDGEAGNFYFEVRKEGVSVDPAKVLKKL
jgi:septal ring factor EnvC (AmiA/AmiB activator)